MNSQKNIVCKIFKNRKLKEVVLKRRIKKLEEYITNEVENIIIRYPVEASKMDDIKKSFPSSAITDAELQLMAAKRLLLNISKN